MSAANPNLAAALALHRAGDLAGAGATYEAMLAASPQEPRALQYLGVLRMQQGRLDEAESLLREYLQREPCSAEGYGHLGLVLEAGGRLEQAVAAYERSLALKPDAVDVRVNLGNALRQAGRLESAILAYRQAIADSPAFAEAQHNLGLALLEREDFAAAADALAAADRSRPNCLSTLLHLGDALARLCRWPEAADAYQQATGLDPANAAAWFNWSVALHEQRQWPAALAAARQAVNLQPKWAAAQNHLSAMLLLGGEARAALAAAEAALALQPEFAEALNNHGNACQALGHVERAIASYRRSIQLHPRNADCFSNLGNVLRQIGELDEAAAALQTAVAIAPALGEAHNNLGNVHRERGELDAALARYAAAAELSGDALLAAAADSNRVYTLHFHAGFDAEAVEREHRAWEARHARVLPFSRRPRPALADHGTGRLNEDGRLRVGYVSPDFRDHCQSLFTLPLLSNHDREKVEVFCYSDVAVPDAVTARVRSHAEHWVEIAGRSDAEVAERVAADGIDVLVDLTAHMANNRLLLFARRAAPVQVSWLAYPASTGVSAIDFSISDPWLEPPGLPTHSTGKLLRLPKSFWCYDPMSNEPVGELPAHRHGHITFGCLNSFCKVTERTLELWAAAMAAVPASRLLLLAPAGSARRRVLEKLAAMGVSEERVRFVPRQSRAAYLRTFHQIDLCLDTFPYNGHTTTLDSLWMGVPVVRAIGQTSVGRAGWSMLNNVGLPEWVARTAGEFAALAAAVVGDVRRLGELRRTLRGRLSESALMDGPGFSRHMEVAYRNMCELNQVGSIAA